MLYRLFSFVISILISFIVFNYTYKEFQTILPYIDFKDQRYVTAQINEIRKMYNEAFNHSITYSFIAFVLLMIIFEYLRLGNILSFLFKGMKKDIQDIRANNTSD